MHQHKLFYPSLVPVHSGICQVHVLEPVAHYTASPQLDGSCFTAKFKKKSSGSRYALHSDLGFHTFHSIYVYFFFCLHHSGLNAYDKTITPQQLTYLFDLLGKTNCQMFFGKMHCINALQLHTVVVIKVVFNTHFQLDAVHDDF